jgi:peroxiredoxin
MLNKLRAYLTGKKVYSIFLHLVVVILLVEVVFLARQNKELKQGPTYAQEESLRVGDYFSLSGIAHLDRNRRLDSTAARQLIFVFTTRCPFCKETLPLWEKIASQTKSVKDVALIGICLDEEAATKAYVEQHGLGFPVFLSVSKESLVQRNKLHGVPETIIRAKDGRVEKIWNGRLSDEHFQEVVKAISNIKPIQIPIRGDLR